jgi:murein DD-endopeptidase MepM/ murein hydrolase activator NlpD
MNLKYAIVSGALILSMLPGTASAASKSDLKDKINLLEQQVQQVNESKNGLKNELKNIQSEINTTNDKVKESQNKINKIENDIKTLTNEITILNDYIVKKEIELALKQKELDEKKKILGQTISFLYENKDVSFVEFFFQSGNLDEILNSFEFIQTIASENDMVYKEVQRQEKELKIEKENLEIKKASIQSKLKETETLKLSLVEEKKVLDNLLVKQKAEESIIVDRLIQAEITENAAMAEIISATSQIEAIAIEEARQQAAIEAANRAKLQSNIKSTIPSSSNEKTDSSAPSSLTPRVTYSSQLVTPMKRGTYTFTSDFGYRVHPIFKTKHLHSGIDLAAPNGTPIYAAGSGKVIYAGPAQGYGNLIVILHANNLYTLYAHSYAQNIKVKAGQNVSTGDPITGVGSAGNSTGPHLHFSVAEGKTGSKYNFVNPLNYVSR